MFLPAWGTLASYELIGPHNSPVLRLFQVRGGGKLISIIAWGVDGEHRPTLPSWQAPSALLSARGAFRDPPVLVTRSFMNARRAQPPAQEIQAESEHDHSVLIH